MSVSANGGRISSNGGISNASGKILRPTLPKGTASSPPAKTFLRQPAMISESEAYMRVDNCSTPSISTTLLRAAKKRWASSRSSATEERTLP